MTRWSPEPPATPLTIQALGDRALLARFADETTAASWVRAVRAAARPEIHDIVLAYATAAIHLDPDAQDLTRLTSWLFQLSPNPECDPAGSTHIIPVLYDGPDLAEVASRLHLTPGRVVELHCEHPFHVFAIGFLPGFPYAGYLPPELSGLKRRDTPRSRVPEGAVAIAGRQTGIYPGPSPGGWHLLGQTPLRIVDEAAARFPIRAGDLLRFTPMERSTFQRLEGCPLWLWDGSI